MASDKKYKLASRQAKPNRTVVNVKGVEIGSKKIAVMAGPCAVESGQQLAETARAVKEAGASVLRASAFKPRTSPYGFQGLGEEGLKLIKKAGEETGLVTETEVVDTRHISLVSKYVDILRIGARNMTNFELVKEVGKAGKPVILKNGLASTAEEFLLAAEYLLNEGNKDVILCYRGTKGFDPATRFALDISLIPWLKKETHLPVIVDPSHSAGHKNLVFGAAKAAVAAGADGLMVEVHPNPEKALSDNAQQLLPEEFSKLMGELKRVAKAVGREI